MTWTNLIKTMPESLTQFSNLSKSIEWSTVLNVANSINIEMLLESVLRRMSFTTLIRAVSVLWRGQNPDWRLL